MVDPKPLRPRATRERYRGKRIERVAVDLIDLRALTTELAAVGPVTLTSAQFEGEASSVEEFASHGFRSLDSLTMGARSETNYGQSISLDFNRDHVFIHASSNADHLVAGVELQVEQICRSRVRRVGNWAAWLVFPLVMAAMLAGFVALLVIVVAFGREESGGTDMSDWWLAPSVACLVATLLAALVARRTKGEILLVPRADAPGWLARNRDALAVNVVGGVLLLGIGVLIGRLT